MQKNSSYMSALAAGEPTTMDIGQVRTAMTNFITTTCSLLDLLEDGPLKAKFLEVKEKLNTALAGLPATDQVPAAAQSNVILRDILSMFISAQDMMNRLTEAAKETATKSSTALAGLPKQISDGVTAAINSQVAAGTLFTKADHDAALTAATTTATKTANDAAAANIGKVSTRMAALASASLPAPESTVLITLTDADFAAYETKMKARKTELDAFKLGPDRMKALMSASDADYASSLALVKELKGSAAPNPAPRNPLEGGPAPVPNPVGRVGYFC